MKFNSSKEMLDCIQEGKDFYNPTLELYVFKYNETGSLAYYNIDNEQAKELSRVAKEADEYWGSFLGAGGRIVDAYSKNSQTPIEWCDTVFQESNWIDTDLYLKD